jgi:hypothetical protein
MPFDVVFDIAYDQQRVLLEQSKPQRVGNADLFCGRILAGASRPVEQISSRLCPLSTLFAFLSREACASAFIARSAGDVGWDSTVVFSCSKATRGVIKHRRSHRRIVAT